MEFIWCIPVCPITTCLTYYLYQEGQYVSEKRVRNRTVSKLLDLSLNFWSQVVETVLGSDSESDTSEPEWDSDINWISTPHPKSD